ncbi:glutathione-disulfide reductase [Teredinibacter turnerae]|uniref:glutathione-disulfide reductase n=1 Tax=Teredinibacter turnerae TaxID=2426 RepID=UPI0030D522E2
MSEDVMDFDLFVIGAGSGGVRASRIAAQLGAKVAVAEDLYLGGTCVNVGCVPKKLFVYGSHFKEDFEAARGFGWSYDNLEFDWQTLRDNKTQEIERLNGVYGRILEGSGVEIIRGRATIAGPNLVAVDGETYTAKNILVATGSWPREPRYPGAEYVTNSNDFFFLHHLPKRVIVEGGGYIAVEFAGILNALGCDTELVYRGEMFLRHFDGDVRRFAAEQIAEKGVKLSFSTDIKAVEKLSNGTLQVTLNAKAEGAAEQVQTRVVDCVISAIGRTPKTRNIGLEALGVNLKPNGAIEVDDNFATNVPGVYAVGDVIDRFQLTPVALAEGMALARNLFADQPITMNYKHIPTAVFCQPNIGTVGYSEEDARESGHEVEVYQSTFKPMKHTLSGLQEKTLMKLVVDKQTRKVLGAHMVGPDAGEIIQGIAIAIKVGATKEDFDATVGIHPTAAEEFVTMRSPRA